MSSSTCPQSECINNCKSPTLVNGIQNQILDVFNRTSYLSAPYSIGPPLASVIPSSALGVSPVVGCGGYGFATTIPSVSFPQPQIAQAIGPQAIGPQAIGPQTQIVQPTGAQSSYQTTQNMLPGTTNNGSKPIQKSSPSPPDPRNIVGPTSSSKNLLTATGQSCCDDGDFSTPVEPRDTMDYIPTLSNTIGSSLPGVVVGGVGGVGLGTAFLGGNPNVNLASGIAFGQECGINYGLNAPLAVAGPISPSINVLGSNYLNNLPVTPYYSGLNQSEPAAVMHSVNPVFPGFMMLARAWNGIPQVIISKPDKFGCPQFETISIETHSDNCNCDKCNCFSIDNCEYNCINGFGTQNPFSDNLFVIGGNLVSSNIFGPRELRFTITNSSGYPLVPVAGLTGTYNTSWIALSVNGQLNRNLVLYKNCTYNVFLDIDPNLDPSLLPLANSARANLIFTIDPAGQNMDASCNIGSPLITNIINFANDAGWFKVNDCYGLAPKVPNFTYTPDSKLFNCLVTTIYYQFLGIAYGGGPITILGDCS